MDTIKRKIIGEDFNNLDNYIKIVVTLTCKPSVYIKLFGKIGLEDVASISFFNFNLTNNPYQQILNTTYKCVGLEYDGSDIISKWAKATEEELANTVP